MDNFLEMDLQDRFLSGSRHLLLGLLKFRSLLGHLVVGMLDGVTRLAVFKNIVSHALPKVTHCELQGIS